MEAWYIRMEVSVVMPAYNAEKYIAEAISSVLNQSFPDFELIVLNDGSTDGTGGIVQRFAGQDKRIRLLNQAENRGAARTRNDGVQAARGEWVAFLDSDDIWIDTKLEKQLDFVRRYPEAVLTYTASGYMDEGGTPFGYILHAKERLTYQELLCGNPIVCSSVMVKRNRMREVPMIDDEIHEDYVSWMRFLRNGSFAWGLDEPLVWHRLLPDSRSGRRLRSGKMMLRSYLVLGYGFPMALALTARYAAYSVRKRHLIRKSGRCADSLNRGEKPE